MWMILAHKVQVLYVFLIYCKNRLLPFRDEPLRLWPVLGVVVEKACWDLKRRSFREELAVHHTVLVDVSCKPLLGEKCHV